ncbi:hypothetical protein Nepgr_010647 [Nepenthes gracilis]|uniref:Uncharacterized protein n=1 Tax=Nepenthes gracilis TaxID=150966 RepID=A0AAD3SDU2_NEPGR|nr:hypothetical protein Nepgr_010647 [Nepenthes gracilis]
MVISELPKMWRDELKFSTVVEVKRPGTMAGKHPVLLFSKPSKPGDDENPMKMPAGFQSVNLEGGEKGSIYM